MGGSHKHHSCNVYDCPILEMPGEAMKNGRRPFFIAPPGIGIWGAVIYITPAQCRTSMFFKTDSTLVWKKRG